MANSTEGKKEKKNYRITVITPMGKSHYFHVDNIRKKQKDPAADGTIKDRLLITNSDESVVTEILTLLSEEKDCQIVSTYLPVKCKILKISYSYDGVRVLEDDSIEYEVSQFFNTAQEKKK